MGGSVAGIESDENGNVSFSPEKFALGLLGGAVGRNRHLIKDFYHLYNINRTTYEPPLETLKDIRKKEYLGIGSNERLFKEYREFTQKLIDNI